MKIQKTEFDHSHNLRCRRRHVICSWLRRDGISEHDIPAHCGWIPRAHAANAKATADLRCFATLQGGACHVQGHVFYVYKDEKAGVAYVGREQEYQNYQQLAIQQQIAQNYYTAVAMDRAAAYGWIRSMGSASVLVVKGAPKLAHNRSET